MNKEYKALFVPSDLHQKIKLEATKNQLTIINYLKLLCQKEKEAKKKK